MNPLVTGWFDTLLILISAVMAYEWIIERNTHIRYSMISIIRSFYCSKTPAFAVMPPGIDSAKLSDRRSHRPDSILSP